MHRVLAIIMSWCVCVRRKLQLHLTGVTPAPQINKVLTNKLLKLEHAPAAGACWGACLRHKTFATYDEEHFLSAEACLGRYLKNMLWHATTTDGRLYIDNVSRGLPRYVDMLWHATASEAWGS